MHRAGSRRFMSNVVLSLRLSWLQYGYDYGVRMKDAAFEDYSYGLQLHCKNKFLISIFI